MSRLTLPVAGPDGEAPWPTFGVLGPAGGDDEDWNLRFLLGNCKLGVLKIAGRFPDAGVLDPDQLLPASVPVPLDPSSHKS